jgi:nucleoside-diphosphate-sugar epimerase
MGESSLVVGAGVIGSRVAGMLAERGDRVRVVSRHGSGPAGVAADQRSPATAMEAVAAGPVPIKHFCSFLSISLDNRPPMCQK